MITKKNAEKFLDAFTFELVLAKKNLLEKAIEKPRKARLAPSITVTGAKEEAKEVKIIPRFFPSISVAEGEAMPAPPIPAPIPKTPIKPAVVSLEEAAIPSPLIKIPEAIPVTISKAIPKAPALPAPAPAAVRMPAPAAVRMPVPAVSVPTAPYVRPAAREARKPITNFASLLEDKSVKMISCEAGNPIVIRRNGEEEQTALVMSAEEVRALIENFSKQTKIPILENVFSAALHDLHINAIISEEIPPRFVITRKEELEVPEPSARSA